MGSGSKRPARAAPAQTGTVSALARWAQQVGGEEEGEPELHNMVLNIAQHIVDTNKGTMTFSTTVMTTIRVKITPMIVFVINERVTRPGRALTLNCISYFQLDGDRVSSGGTHKHDLDLSKIRFRRLGKNVELNSIE